MEFWEFELEYLTFQNFEKFKEGKDINEVEYEDYEDIEDVMKQWDKEDSVSIDSDEWEPIDEG